MRPFNDWEVELVANLLSVLQKVRVTAEVDKVLWKGAAGGSFFSKWGFQVVTAKAASSFPVKGIWVSCVPQESIPPVLIVWEKRV